MRKDFVLAHNLQPHGKELLPQTIGPNQLVKCSYSLKMVAKCCWRKEKKVKSHKEEEKEALLKRGSVDSSFTVESVNSCHRRSDAYEEECEARLENGAVGGSSVASGSRDQLDSPMIIRAEESLIDLTHKSSAPVPVQSTHINQNQNHRLQHSPKVTFFDQGEDLAPGSTSPPKPRRARDKIQTSEKRSRSAPEKPSRVESPDNIVRVDEQQQRASIVSTEQMRSSLKNLSQEEKEMKQLSEVIRHERCVSDNPLSSTRKVHFPAVCAWLKGVFRFEMKYWQ